MADLVGHTDWTTGTPAWPAGSQVGDLAVAVLSREGTQFSTPNGWTTVGTFNVRSFISVTEYAGYGTYRIVTTSESSRALRVVAKFVTAADLTAPIWPGASSSSSPEATATTYRDTGGVGAVRTGSSAAPAKAGGGIWSIYTQASTTPRAALSALGTHRQVGYTSFRDQNGVSGTTTTFAHLGWVQATSDGTLGDPTAAGNAVTIEILPPVAPLAPNLTAPAEGDVSAGVDLEVAWVHRPVLAGGYPDARQVQVAVDDGGELDWKWYNPTDGSLSASEVVTLGSATSETLDGALLVSGDTVLIRVMTREGLDGRWSTWSSARVVHAVTPPSVVVTAPTGTIADDWTPTISWTPTTPTGVQVAYQVRVSRDGADVFNSGSLTGAVTSLSAPVIDWVQGGEYTAHVRVQQTGGSWSSWASTTFVMSWTLPAAPTVTATPGANGIEVTVAGAEVDDEVELQRLDPDATWAAVSTIAVAEADPTLTDVTAPYGVDVIYRARVLASLDGASLPSEWAESGAVRSLDRGCYLVDAEAPLSSWLPVRWSGESTRSTVQERSVWRGLGDDRTSVVQGRYLGESGTWQFSARTLQERADLREFLLRPHALILRTPAELQPGEDGKRTLVDTGTVTFTVTAGPDVSRLAQAGIADRWLEVEWTEAAPVRPFERQRTAGVIDLAGAVIEPGPGGTILLTVPAGG